MTAESNCFVKPLMDETEITNNEYRQLLSGMHFLAYKTLKDDGGMEDWCNGRCGRRHTR